MLDPDHRVDGQGDAPGMSPLNRLVEQAGGDDELGAAPLHPVAAIVAAGNLQIPQGSRERLVVALASGERASHPPDRSNRAAFVNRTSGSTQWNAVAEMINSNEQSGA